MVQLVAVLHSIVGEVNAQLVVGRVMGGNLWQLAGYLSRCDECGVTFSYGHHCLVLDDWVVTSYSLWSQIQSWNTEY